MKPWTFARDHSVLLRIALLSSILFALQQGRCATATQVAAELNGQFAGATCTFRAVPNMCKKVYVTVEGREYYYLHRESRFFPNKVSIPDAKFTRISNGGDSNTAMAGSKMAPTSGLNDLRNYIRVEFQHPHLSRGDIKISQVNGKPIDRTDDVVKILGYAFEAKDLPRTKLFIGDAKTKLVYFAGVNHLPPVGDRVEFETCQQAEDAGYLPTKLSFARVPQIPSFETEFLLGLQASSSVRTYSPADTDDKHRQRVTRVGQQVLDHWPTSLKGYNYKFYVLDMNMPNASACPTGWIFIHTGMLDILESDGELEAVLAHEIAHVEKRHGLRMYRTAQTGAAIGGILTLGIAAAAASDNRGNSAAMAIGISGIILNVSSAIAMTGYSRTFETEADQCAAMYLLRNGKDPQLLSRALRKLRYHQDLIGRIGSQGSMFGSHPALDDRIELAEHTSLKLVDKPLVFDGYSKDDELVATISFEAEFMHSSPKTQNTLTVLAELSTTTALEKQDKVTSISIKTGGKSVTLTNSEKTPVDPLDSITVSFQTTAVKLGVLGGLEDIKFSLGPVRRWERRRD